jgi:hypothetical protein
VKAYYTLCKYDPAAARWHDEFGAFDRREVEAEMEDHRDHGTKAKHLVIVKHAPTAAAMIAARDALPTL